MDPSEGLETYVLNSKYRSHVVSHLAEGPPATPKEIAEAVDEPRPHVSRALAELRERDVVELRVPESRTVGRYYALTKCGVDLWTEIRDRVRRVEWSIAEPSSAAQRDVVDLARNEFGDRLRVVVYYDGSEAIVLEADPDVLASYSDEEFERGLRTFVFDHKLSDIDVPDEDVSSEIVEFSEFSVLRVGLPDDSQIAISFDNAHDVSFPAFADAISSIFEAGGGTA